jgi:hypothetical protein
MATNHGIVGENANIASVNSDNEVLTHDAHIIDAVNAIPIGGNLDPKFYTSKTEITLGDTDTTLATITFDGVLQSININFDKTTVEVVLEVDSTEIFRAELGDLNDTSIYDLGIPNQASGASPGFVGVANSGKHLQMSLDTKIATNVVLKAKRTLGVTTKMKGIIVFYREYP